MAAIASVADDARFCDATRMRSLPIWTVGAVALASCAPHAMNLSADRCWSVSVGDRVEGTAILVAYSGIACTECGASVSGRGCRGVGFATANVSVHQAYDRIVHSAPADRYGFVQIAVFLSGEVIPEGGTGKPLIRATQLRLAGSSGG